MGVGSCRSALVQGALAVLGVPGIDGRLGGVGVVVAGLLDLGRGRVHARRLEGAAVGGVARGPQVDDEGEDVEGEDEGDGPLEDGGVVEVVVQVAHAEADGEAELDDDEDELDPEGDAQDAVLAVLDAEALVLPADEDGGQQVAGDEEHEEDVVQLGVAGRVEARQAGQADGADEGEEDGEAREHLLAQARVGHEAALVPQPPVEAEGQVEEDGGDDAARHEQRLELRGAHVRDVRDGLLRVHRVVMDPVRIDNPVYQHAQQHADPYRAGNDGENLGRVAG